MAEKRGTSSVAALMMARTNENNGREITGSRPGTDGGRDRVREPGAGGDQGGLVGIAREGEAGVWLTWLGQSPFNSAQSVKYCV
jgi:hypothetical protein